MYQTHAVADIGSNTAHLLVATVSDSKIQRLANQSIWLDLGQHVRQHGEFLPEKSAAIVDALKNFKGVAQSLGATDLYCFATEAMRAAKNRESILSRIHELTNLTVNLISREEEAILSCRAMQSEFPQTQEAIMVEIGGGSVQFAHWRNRNLVSLQSLELGTGLLAAEASLTHPSTPAQIRVIENLIADSCQTLAPPAEPLQVILCGGVTRGIWRALHPDREKELHVNELRFLSWDCDRLTGKTIASRYKVKPKRALTLATGSRVLTQILEKLGTDTATVCQSGVREGAILSLADPKQIAE